MTSEPAWYDPNGEAVQAIRWTGSNMAAVLEFTGHADTVVNSFGNPVVGMSTQPQVAEPGDRILLTWSGHLYVCPDLLFQALFKPMEAP